ncbi:MAG: class I SAM-dependent methyltransferase [Promethearchaeota archaeon]
MWGAAGGPPGMWIARETGADYVGIDLSEIGVESAKQRVMEFGLNNKARFHIGDICAISFPDDYFDGAISIDVLGFIPNQLAALYKVARILRSGALFVFTTWEAKEPNMVNEYRPLLRKAGFKVKIYDETPDWERLQREVYQTVLESKDILIEDMGADRAFIWIMEAKKYLPSLKDRRRILVAAKKI